MTTQNQCSLLGLFFAVLASSLLVGCGSSESSTGDSSTESAKDTELAPGDKTPEVVFDNRTPEQVVTIFLESLRSGKDREMKEMLTAAAQENNILNAGESDSTFEVFKAQFYEQETETLAYVPANWTRNDGSGQTARVLQVKWALRKMPEGWRVGGLAMFVPELNNWELLNFEDQEKMEAKQRELWPDIKRQRFDASANVAERPVAPESPVQK